MRYIFCDLDNTLCDSKQPLSRGVLEELKRLNEKNKICIVSGAEIERMRMQAPLLYSAFFAQNGNETYDGEELLWKNEFPQKERVLEHVRLLAQYLDIEITDDMIDDRGSQVSFSLVGHNADPLLKNAFDPDRHIRMNLLDLYPFEGAVIGGTTCIDYVPATKGKNILRFMKLKGLNPSECLYIGDAFMKYGNDETVLGIIPILKVDNWSQTLKFLKQIK